MTSRRLLVLAASAALLFSSTAQARYMGKFTATAYGPPWNALEGGPQTATGVRLPGLGGKQKYVVAVDPRVIPYHSRLKIWPNPFGDRNIVFRAEDTGGAIKGNRIDFFTTQGRQAQNRWGRRGVRVTRVSEPFTPAGTRPVQKGTKTRSTPRSQPASDRQALLQAYLAQAPRTATLPRPAMDPVAGRFLRRFKGMT